MYPLKFTPIVLPKIWGEEAWLLSGYGDNMSLVNNGYLKGNSLDELIEVYMDELLGQHVCDKYGSSFPLLFKRITAQDRLSIQVHPNDEQAAQANSFGKSEMWYVTEASPEAKVVMGFANKTNSKQVKQAIEDLTLPDLVNNVTVNRGDMFYIPAGTIHALCGGTEVLEIQQSSDLTYRIYDYGRRDDKGNLRQLHVAEALDVLDYNRLLQTTVDYEPIDDEVVRGVSDDHFITNIISLTHPATRDYAMLDSFVVLMAAEGSFSIESDGELVDCKNKELVLLPASSTDVIIRPQGANCKILEVYVP